MGSVVWQNINVKFKMEETCSLLVVTGKQKKELGVPMSLSRTHPQ
jgi:hypothetical protein